MISVNTRRTIVLMGLGSLLCCFTYIMIDGAFPVRSLSSVCWGIWIMVWAVTIKRRITGKRIRRYILLSSFLFVSLFMVRMIRYMLPRELFFLDENMLNTYYIFLVIPALLMFFCSIAIGRREDEKLPRFCLFLMVMAVLLCLGILTNSRHHKLITMSEENFKITGHGWLYVVVVLWIVMFLVLSLITMIRKCRLQSRRLWWIPIVSIIPPVILLAAYFICGGSPVLSGKKLYQFQEAFCLLYVMFWESCIQIGLIPSNSDYGDIFPLSSTRAFLMDREGNTVYQSSGEIPVTEELKREVLKKDLTLPGFLRLRSYPISGGTVCWIDDMVNVEQMNESLMEAVNLISEENTLIREEQRLHEMQTKLETKNRLYDEIAFRVHGQLSDISHLLSEKDGSGEAFHKKLAYISVLGAYVKRRANLILIAEQNECLDLEELSLAARESMEYLGLADITCMVSVMGEGKISAGTVLLAYDFLEHILECAFPDFSSIYVTIEKREEFSLTCMLDNPSCLSEADMDSWQVAVTREDDAVYARFYERGAACD